MRPPCVMLLLFQELAIQNLIMKQWVSLLLYILIIEEGFFKFR